MSKCEQCGDDFIPRQADQRFCNRVCSSIWHSEERRRAIELWRTHGKTVQREEQTQ